MNIPVIENNKIRKEMDQVIGELKEKGIKFNSKESEIIGLGDLVESALKKFGITEERFTQWFNLKECKCAERKKFLNNLFSWRNIKIGDKHE